MVIDMENHKDIKISCLPVRLFESINNGIVSIREWAEIGRKAGFDGIDLSAMFLKRHEPRFRTIMKNEVKAAGIPLVMVTTYPDFTHPEYLQRERELQYLVRDIMFASELGAQYIRVLAGQAHPGVDLDSGIKWAVEYLLKAQEMTQDLMVKLVYENHAKPSAWNYSDFSQEEDVFLRIANEVVPSGIGINFDTANPIASKKDPVELLNLVLPALSTVHVADTAMVGMLSPVPVGLGAVPLKKVFGVLKTNRYDGWLCVEDTYSDTLDKFRETCSRVRALWNNTEHEN